MATPATGHTFTTSGYLISAPVTAAGAANDGRRLWEASLAATHYNPLPAEIEDPVTYKEAVALFARTGHKASESTVRNYVRDAGLATVFVGKTAYVSWTDLLEVHFQRTAVKLRASSNWP